MAQVVVMNYNFYFLERKIGRITQDEKYKKILHHLKKKKLIQKLNKGDLIENISEYQSFKPKIYIYLNKKNENKEKKKARWRKREAIRKNSFSIPYLESEVLEKYGTLCYICSEEINLSVSRRAGIGKGWRNGLHIDHVIPLSQGGPDSLENVRPSHAICNLKKGKQLISKEM